MNEKKTRIATRFICFALLWFDSIEFTIAHALCLRFISDISYENAMGKWHWYVLALVHLLTCVNEKTKQNTIGKK